MELCSCLIKQIVKSEKGPHLLVKKYYQYEENKKNVLQIRQFEVNLVEKSGLGNISGGDFKERDTPYFVSWWRQTQARQFSGEGLLQATAFPKGGRGAWKDKRPGERDLSANTKSLDFTEHRSAR